MQPKAAKKIGGMTPKKIGGMAPKKMTGGTYGAEEEIKDFSYKITKQIDEENGMMKICVESEMPKGTMVVPPATNNSDVTPGQQPGKQPGEKPGEKPGEGAATEEAAAAEQLKDEDQDGGKKKRKSSKKRKSMKKGGMKRKSMKVKA
jgi:hypothetical protein